jgi:hypothetical protein
MLDINTMSTSIEDSQHKLVGAIAHEIAQDARRIRH